MSSIEDESGAEPSVVMDTWQNETWIVITLMRTEMKKNFFIAWDFG
jgi:hypothetical protein